MLAGARLLNGKVTHFWDVKKEGQFYYYSLCGQWKTYHQLVSYRLQRDCKTCVRMNGYHLKRPRPM